MSRRTLIGLATAAIAAVLAIGISQAKHPHTSGPAFRLSDARRALAGAPAPLATLHAQASKLLPGSTDTVRARLVALRGHPVVLNKWASWCGPCRGEFPTMERAGVSYGKRVAFIGLDSGDNRQDASTFLKRFPLPYPSYEDPNARTATALHAAGGYPTTVFYDARGRMQYAHQGPYNSEAVLARDIERYALGRG